MCDGGLVVNFGFRNCSSCSLPLTRKKKTAWFSQMIELNHPVKILVQILNMFGCFCPNAAFCLNSENSIFFLNFFLTKSVYFDLGTNFPTVVL